MRALSKSQNFRMPASALSRPSGRAERSRRSAPGFCTCNNRGPAPLLLLAVAQVDAHHTAPPRTNSDHLRAT